MTTQVEHRKIPADPDRRFRRPDRRLDRRHGATLSRLTAHKRPPVQRGTAERKRSAVWRFRASQIPSARIGASFRAPFSVRARRTNTARCVRMKTGTRNPGIRNIGSSAIRLVSGPSVKIRSGEFDRRRSRRGRPPGPDRRSRRGSRRRRADASQPLHAATKIATGSAATPTKTSPHPALGANGAGSRPACVVDDEEIAEDPQSVHADEDRKRNAVERASKDRHARREKSDRDDRQDAPRCRRRAFRVRRG